MTEHAAHVATAVADILDTTTPGEHPAIGELARLRSGTRRILEADLAPEAECRLLAALAPHVRTAALPGWALDAVLAEMHDPEPSPTPSLRFEQAQRRLRQQGAESCPLCCTPTASEHDLQRWERHRRWNLEDGHARRAAAPLAGVTP